MSLMTLILISCAFDPDRQISSVEEPIVFGVADVAHSEVRYLPPENTGHADQQLFLLSLKDSSGKVVDVDTYGIKILKSKQTIPYEIERISPGRYTLLFNSDNLDNLIMKLDGKYFSLKQPSKSLPSSKKSFANIVHKDRYEITVRVFLNDKLGKPVILEDVPDVIFEGPEVHVKDTHMVSTGIWDIKIQTLEDNFILYLSIRANGVLLPRLYRVQHVEK